MDQQILIIAGLGILGFAALAFVLLAPTEKDRANKRLGDITSRTGASRGGSGAAANNELQAKERRKRVTDTLNAIEDKNKNLKKKQRVPLDQLLEQTGLPAKPKHYYMASVGTAFFCALIGLISGQALWVTGLMFLVGGLGLPRWAVGFFEDTSAKEICDRVFECDRRDCARCLNPVCQSMSA